MIPDITVPASPNTATTFFKNLLAGLRALIFLRPRSQPQQATWIQFILLALSTLAIQFIFNFIDVGPEGHVSSMGVSGLLFYVPLVIMAAWLITARSTQPTRIMELLVLFSAMHLVLEIVGLATGQSYLHLPFLSRNADGWIYELSSWWLPITCGIAALRIIQWDRPRKKLIVLSAVLLMGFTSQEIYLPKILWFKPRHDIEDDQAQFNPLNQEDVFYQQPKLLGGAISKLQAERRSDRNLFFVGVAGDGEEDVFMKEVLSIDSMLKERFDTDGHSILLINNPKTVANYPIASATGLGVALKAVAAKMNLDKDILLLYMTSHGSKDHKFYLKMGEMKFNPIGPQQLRKLLDESGIKNRVIVVSACYSGGYVPVLQGDNSLIVTSAARDKTSFGCGSNEDYTYFGRAYFAESLRKTDSFIKAFGMSTPVIKQREAEAGATASDPQMSVGSTIEKTLDDFSRDLVLRHEAGRKELVGAATGSTHSEPPKTVDTQSANLELARQLTARLSFDNQIKRSVEVCLDAAKERTAEERLSKEPNYFYGLTPKSAVWPQVAAAYYDYQDVMCKQMAKNSYSDLAAEVYSERMSRAELSQSIQFFSSTAGKAMVAAGPYASETYQREMTKNQAVVQQVEDAKYWARIKELVTEDKASRAQKVERPWWQFWRDWHMTVR